MPDRPRPISTIDGCYVESRGWLGSVFVLDTTRLIKILKFYVISASVGEKGTRKVIPSVAVHDRNCPTLTTNETNHWKVIVHVDLNEHRSLTEGSPCYVAISGGGRGGEGGVLGQLFNYGVITTIQK